MWSIISWVKDNYSEALQASAGLVVVIELIVRLVVPTSTSISALQLVGGLINTTMNFLKVPVLLKTPDGIKYTAPETKE